MAKIINPLSANRFVLLKFGFRAFFLLAGLSGLLLLSLWVFLYSTRFSFVNYYDLAMGWHGHEMLFGFAMAVMTGYILTTIEVWTGLRSVRGLSLLMLASLWLLGRIAPVMPEFPAWLVAVIDIAYLPVLSFLILPQIVARGKAAFRFVVAILWLMTFANVCIHFQLLGLIENTAKFGQNLMLYLMLLLIVMIGGQFTTQNNAEHGLKAESIVNFLAIVSVIAFALVNFFVGSVFINLLAAIFGALVHGYRIVLWRKSTQDPMMKTLHLSYVWIVVGFVLFGLNALGLVRSVLALHAFAAGGIGALGMVMMIRITSDRTTQPKHESWLSFSIVIAIHLAVVSRVILPAIFGVAFYSNLIILSGLFWAWAFLAFLIKFTPILVFSRAEDIPTRPVTLENVNHSTKIHLPNIPKIPRIP